MLISNHVISPLRSWSHFVLLDDLVCMSKTVPYDQYLEKYGDSKAFAI